MGRKSNILAKRLEAAFTLNTANVAISKGASQWTYSELAASALAISSCITVNAGNREPVAILGNKNFFTYAGICGALFASGAYMPLNLKFPPSRNVKMLELTAAKIIVADDNAAEMLDKILSISRETFTIILESTDVNLVQKFPQHRFVVATKTAGNKFPVNAASPEDVAYLLFTSGTTGIPKGVPVSNGNVCSYLDHVMDRWEFREDDRFSQTFDLTFDLSVHDMMICWLSGGSLCIPEDDSAFKMASYIREQAISVWFAVPSMAILMNKMRLLKPNALDGIRLSFFCGEPLAVNIAAKWSGATAGREVINLYGPSEATIAISDYSWKNQDSKSRNDIVSIGSLFSGQEYCLIDQATMKQTETKGELCLGGTQIIKGYLNDQALTEKYFISLDEQPGKTWYRTGDLVEQDEDGMLFFLGRSDSEVKISGFRVNLFEIDALLRKHTGSEQVATILDEGDTNRIISFAGKDGRMSEAELIRKCREELPWYMIPEVIIFVDEMPLNINGKIDRNKLKQRLHEQD